MEIRLMNTSDYDGAYSLWRSCAGMGLNNLDDSREGFARFLRRNPETCFAAVEDGRIIGTILAGNDGRRGFIYHTAVHPGYRRQGIGTALVNAAIDAMQTLGIHKVTLVVYARNAEGNAFWEAQGFTAREDLTYRNRTLTEMTVTVT